MIQFGEHIFLNGLKPPTGGLLTLQKLFNTNLRLIGVEEISVQNWSVVLQVDDGDDVAAANDHDDDDDNDDQGVTSIIDSGSKLNRWFLESRHQDTSFAKITKHPWKAVCLSI